jgi:hypothetical protein
MNKFNKMVGSTLALVAVLANVILAPVTSAAGSMNDPEFNLALAWGYETGLTSYDTEDAFMPMNTLTREQGAKFLSAFATEVLGTEVDETMDCTFSDANLMDPSLVSSVAAACGQGLLKGSNGKFMPTNPMTKAQFITALVRGLDGTMDETTSPWYLNYCTWAQENGITKEQNCTALDRPVTRYEALLMLYRGSMPEDGTDPVDPTDETPTTGTTVAGEVSINISDETPGVQYVPGTGNNIQALKFDVTAGESAVKLSAINFKLAGLVSRDRVQISIVDENGVRLSTERSFNTAFEALVTANTSAGITVPANSTRSFYAVLKTMGSVNERFNIAIESATSVSSNATVGGTFPIVSNQINTTQYSSQNVTFRGETTGAVAAASISDKLYVGNTNKQLGRFELNTTSSNSRDITVKNIRLKSTDTVEGVVSNLKLEVNGVNVAKSVVVDGKFVTFVVDDFVIPYGNSRTFFIKGDVIGGEKNDNVQFFLDSATDVVALENGTNASVSVSIDGGLTPRSYLKAYTIVEGDNYISRTDGLTSNRNVPADANKILALKANINATSQMSVDKIAVNYMGTATGSTIEAVQLYVNGLLVDEISSFPSTTGGTLTFSFYGNLNAGSNSVEVRMDTQRNAIDGQNIKFTINSNALIGAEYTATSNAVLSTDISGTADGVYLIVRKSSVEKIARTFVANPQIAIREGDITAIKFAVSANNVRDLIVRGFSVNLSGASNSAGGVQDATLYVAGTSGALDIESFSRGNAVTFNGLNVTIPAGTSKEFWVTVKTTVDLPSAATTSPFDLQFFVNNFDIEDSEGNSTTIPTLYTSVAGNLIDVKAALEVFGNRTSTTQSAIIPASTTNSVNVGTFELKSDFAAASVEEITLVNLKSTFTGTTINSTTTAGQIETNSDGAVVELYQGNTLVGAAQILNGVAYIDLTNPVAIAAGGTAVFNVRVKSNTIITSLGDTNKSIRLGVLNPGSLGNGTTQTLIAAVGNSITASGSFTNLIFNTHTLRATTITFADQTNPAVGSNTLLSVAGQNETTIFKTVVSADASKSANLAKLVFNHTAGGVVAANFKLKIDGTVLSASDATCTYASPKVSCTFSPTGAYANGLTVAAGGSRTIELVADVTASTAISDYVTTSMLEGTATDYSMTTVAGANANATVVWSDNAEPNVTPAATNWFTDAGIEKLPSNAWTFSRQ